MRADKTVVRETLILAAGVAALSVVMEIVFVLLGEFDWTVLLANLLSATMVVLNFFLMGLSVQRALEETEEKDARKRVRASQGLRLLLLGAVIGVSAYTKWCNIWALVIPLVFPRIVMTVRGMLLKDGKEEKAEEKEVDPS